MLKRSAYSNVIGLRRAVNRGQRGVAMLVVLVFTLALTGIAIVSARLALMGESVARNQLDMQVARQAAEAALRDAETDLMLATGVMQGGAACARGDERPVMSQVGRFNAQCTRGQCSYNVDQARLSNYTTAQTSPQFGEAWWPAERGGRWSDAAASNPMQNPGTNCASFAGGVPLGTFTGARQVAGVEVQPEYMIEAIRRGEWFFRITARGFGYRAGTEVVLQSYFTVPSL